MFGIPRNIFKNILTLKHFLYPCFGVVDNRYGGERYENRDMQIRVREKFGQLQKLDGERIPWKMINAAQPMDAVESDIWGIVSETVESCNSKPLKKMWQEGEYVLGTADHES